MRENGLPDYLDHMHEAATHACRLVQGLGKEDFFTGKQTQNAIIMNLITIGEVAMKVMDGYAEFAQAHPEVPWRSMRGMRSRLDDCYFEINLDLVWETLQTALPELLKQLPAVRKEADGEPARTAGRSDDRPLSCPRRRPASPCTL